MTKKSESVEMGILEHLGELRKRLLISAVAITIGSIIAYLYSGPLFDLLSKPYFDSFSGASLIGTGPAEAFVIKLKVAVFAGIILVSPVLFLQLWLFIAPGLYESERKLALPFVFFTTLLFLIGVVFCYKFIFPVAFQFFNEQYRSIGVTPAVRLSEHLALIMQGLVAFGLIFELPILAFFLGRIGVINYKMLIAGSRYAIVVIFIVAAILTPPDVMTQLLMAGPLLVLYGFSILIVKYTAKKEA